MDVDLLDSEDKEALFYSLVAPVEPEIIELDESPPPESASKKSKKKVGRKKGKKKALMYSSKTPRYECTFCFKIFPYQYSLQRHERTHTGHQPFKCVWCPKAFIQKDHLKHHLTKHTGKEALQCPECSEQFENNKLLVNHVSAKHATQDGYTCPICLKEFDLKIATFENHVESHPEPKRHLCKYCPAAYHLDSTLQRHYAVDHSDQISNNPESPYSEGTPSESRLMMNPTVEIIEDVFEAGKGNQDSMPLICHVCGYMAGCPEMLALHLDVQHSLPVVRVRKLPKLPKTDNGEPGPQVKFLVRPCLLIGTNLNDMHLFDVL